MPLPDFGKISFFAAKLGRGRESNPKATFSSNQLAALQLAEPRLTAFP